MHKQRKQTMLLGLRPSGWPRSASPTRPAGRPHKHACHGPPRRRGPPGRTPRSVAVQLVQAVGLGVGGGDGLVEQEAGGGQAGDGEEAEDGGVERGVGVDDVENGPLVGVLEDGADLGGRGSWGAQGGAG